MNQVKVPFFIILFFFFCLFLYTKIAGPIPFFINSIQTNKNSFFYVQGEGEAAAVPNTALLSIGVTKDATNVLDAQSQINTIATKIINDLKVLGIEEKNIKTTNYSVQSKYDYANGKQTTNGYTITQNLEVKVSPIDKANKAVDLSTAAGSNLIGGMTFVLDDAKKKELENTARQQAIKNAKEKAESLARAAGITLGRIVDVQENPSYQPMPYGTERSAVFNADQKEVTPPTALTPGENTVRLSVSLSYETR